MGERGMTTISVGLGTRGYPIHFSEGLVTRGSTAELTPLDAAVGGSVFVVTNETVSGL